MTNVELAVDVVVGTMEVDDEVGELDVVVQVVDVVGTVEVDDEVDEVVELDVVVLIVVVVGGAGVDDDVELDVVVLDVDEEDGDPPPPLQGSEDSISVATYRSKADGPPHISAEFPLHGILQTLLSIGSVPFPKTTPQKHCEPYSTPANEYPPVLHAERQDSTVIADALIWSCCQLVLRWKGRILVNAEVIIASTSFCTVTRAWESAGPFANLRSIDRCATEAFPIVFKASIFVVISWTLISEGNDCIFGNTFIPLQKATHFSTVMFCVSRSVL